MFDERSESVIAVQVVEGPDVSVYGVVAGKLGNGALPGPALRRRQPDSETKAQDAPSNLAIIGRYILTPDIFAALERTPLGDGGEIQLTNGLRLLLKQRNSTDTWSTASATTPATSSAS